MCGFRLEQFCFSRFAIYESLFVSCVMAVRFKAGDLVWGERLAQGPILILTFLPTWCPPGDFGERPVYRILYGGSVFNNASGWIDEYCEKLT